MFDNPPEPPECLRAMLAPRELRENERRALAVVEHPADCAWRCSNCGKHHSHDEGNGWDDCGCDPHDYHGYTSWTGCEGRCGICGGPARSPLHARV